MSQIRRLVTAPRTAGILLFGIFLVQVPTSTLGTLLTSSEALGGAVLFMTAPVALFLPRPSKRRWVIVSFVMVVSSFLALALKSAIALNHELGFRSCYQLQSPLNPDGFRSGSCEATYELLRPEGSSRFDAEIQFGTLNPGEGDLTSLKNTNWNLSAINHLVYNYYDWDPRLPARERLPLTAYWAGETATSDPLLVTYIGEGVIRAGDQTIPFVPTYSTPNSVTVENRESRDIFIEFKWRPPDGSVDPPYAAIAVTDLEGNAAKPTISRLAEHSLLLTGLLTLLCTLLTWCLVIRTLVDQQRQVTYSRVRLSLISVVTALWFTSLLFLNAGIWGPTLTCVVLLALFLVSGVCQTRTQARIIGAFSIVATALVGVFGSGIPWRYVPVLRGGDDFLSYESFAREILVTGSLRAGEDVFFFAPGIRYSLASLHFVLGDSSAWIWVLGIVFLLTSAWVAISRLLVPMFRRKHPRGSIGLVSCYLTGGIALLGLGVLMGSDAVWRSGVIPLSEFPTWPALVIALTLGLTSGGRPLVLIAVGLLLGFALAHRSNQVLGIGATVAITVLIAASASSSLTRIKGAIRALLAVVLPLLAVAGLVPVHNWIYGRRIVLTHDPQAAQGTIVLRPQDLLLGSDAWAAFTDQVLGLLLVPSPTFPIPYDASLDFSEYASPWSAMGWASRILQIGLGLALILVVTRSPGTRWRDLALLSVPLGFFLPHLFLNLSTYYPRHTVAGYLTLSVVLMALSTKWLDRASRGSPAPDGSRALGFAHGTSR